MQRIISTARDIVDSSGLEALTMRTLANALNTSPTVLYRAVNDRDELLDHVVDQTLAEITFDFSDDDAEWRHDCQSAAEAMFAVLSTHREIAPLLIERVPVGPNALMMREQMLAMLLAHGFSVSEAALTFATVARYVIGFAAQLSAEARGRAIEPDALSELYKSFDPQIYPATVAVADALPRQTLKDEFANGLDLMLETLDTRRQRTDIGRPHADT
ncbi:TetR/AcrR family transcriptional regulator C-terminal domain-containing protein [Gordonia sp. NPDC003424]